MQSNWSHDLERCYHQFSVDIARRTDEIRREILYAPTCFLQFLTRFCYHQVLQNLLGTRLSHVRTGLGTVDERAQSSRTTAGKRVGDSPQANASTSARRTGSSYKAARQGSNPAAITGAEIDKECRTHLRSKASLAPAKMASPKPVASLHSMVTNSPVQTRLTTLAASPPSRRRLRQEASDKAPRRSSPMGNAGPSCDGKWYGFLCGVRYFLA